MSTSAESSPAGAPAPAAAPPARRRPLVVATVVLAAVVALADQLTKWWAESALTVSGDPLPLLGELLQLRLIYNSGAALSIGTGMTWPLTIIVVAVVVVIMRMIRRIGSRGWAVALGLLLGGAVGNLVDRLAREPGFARGYVVDFIDYAGFFVGNVADIAIVAAALLIGVLSVVGIGLDGQRHSDAVADAGGDGTAVGQQDAADDGAQDPDGDAGDGAVR